jgi:hypothetical protein
VVAQITIHKQVDAIKLTTDYTSVMVSKIKPVVVECVLNKVIIAKTENVVIL